MGLKVNKHAECKYMMKNPLNSSNVFSVSALVQPPQVMLVAFIAELGTYLKSYSTQYKSCLLGDITGFVTKRNNQNEKKVKFVNNRDFGNFRKNIE